MDIGNNSGNFGNFRGNNGNSSGNISKSNVNTGNVMLPALLVTLTLKIELLLATLSVPNIGYW